ncbi:MAG: threonylcarbamoyl-AMP synthase [Candidatus Moranbacteria bacterium]|nr:threonylcarbamoyl-AMP synthase [Candidatus Moranbacteria bacterium]
MEPITFSEAAKKVRKGEAGVIPTDTLYGLVASAMDSAAVEKVYRIRSRENGKPCIVLLSDTSDLGRFGIVPNDGMLRTLGSVWPGEVSVVLPHDRKEWSHLHRGTGTIAFRVPKNADLRGFLREAGPVVAPSANPAGKNPATTVDEAVRYFGSRCGFFVDGGRLSGLPSTVVRIKDGALQVLRQGSVIFE